ncbi:MAG: helix-turn-helix domain-containing protein [Eggerthellaceae bacterium]|nr:helix-turn-helix domain-containing protein [Eggerthellaceae bacterium]
MSFTLNIAERELEPFGRVVRACEGNPRIGEVRHFLNAATGDGLATVYVCDSAADVMAAHQAGCLAVYVDPGSDEPAPGAVLSVLGGEEASIVFDALLDVAHRFSEWERSMDMLRLSGSTLQELLDISAPFLLNHVVVLDPALKLIAYTKAVPCDDPITVELIEHGYHTEGNISKFKLHRRFKSWAEDEGLVINDTRTICKYTTIVKSFKSRTSFSLIAVMMCNVSDDIDYLADVFGMFAERVSYYAQRDYPDDKPAGIVADTFLKDLICGSLDEAAVEERSRFAGIPETGVFCVFYLEAGDEAMPSPRLLSDVSLAVAPAKTLLVDDAVVVLCFNCVHDSCATCASCSGCSRIHTSSSKRLQGLLEKYGLTCGRSSHFTQLAQAKTAYMQAREAHALSKRESLRKRGQAMNAWSCIFPFDDYTAEYLVGQMPEHAGELLSLTRAGALLEAIERQDAQSHMNNYEFLHAYLVYERRTATVAEQMHMHRNNVGYRIRRIEELFGIDVADARLRQDLLLAYRLRNAVVPNAQRQGRTNVEQAQ